MISSLQEATPMDRRVQPTAACNLAVRFTKSELRRLLLGVAPRILRLPILNLGNKARSLERQWPHPTLQHLQPQDPRLDYSATSDVNEELTTGRIHRSKAPSTPPQFASFT